MKSVLVAAALLCAASPAWPRAGGGGGSGGGCFPAGTPVETLDGAVAIEDIKAGDKVLAWSEEGLISVEVEETIKRKSRLLRLKTSAGSIRVTAEHPFLTRYGFAEAAELQPGDQVGLLKEGRKVWTRVRYVKPLGTGMSEVFNLTVAPPHTFIAGGFIVHNKGGFGGGFGGGSYSSRSYSRGYYGRNRGRWTFFDTIFYGGLAVFLMLFKGISWFQSRTPSSLKAHTLSGARPDEKSRETRAIMESLAPAEKDFDPARLEETVRSVFLKVQAAWQARDYMPIRHLMMPHLFASHTSKVESMRARNELNMMEDAKVHKVDFVHVRCPKGEDGRSFTALVSASARDYTVNDRTNGLIRGSRDESHFQEFWTFYRQNGSWALARIDQIGELDFMNAPNFPATPQAASMAGGKAAAAAAGIAAVAAAGAAQAAGDDSFERGAAILMAGNKPEPAAPKSPEPEGAGLLNRQKMEIAATLAFESVYTSWGANDPAALNPDYISAEALKKLRAIMEARKAEGIAFRFERLAPRRAEVMLVTPAAKSRLRLDEFTARINATAVRTMSRNGKALHRDESPSPFTEYWVFGRQNDCWKLRDILPRMEQSGEDRTKDGAPNPSQIEWYWTA